MSHYNEQPARDPATPDDVTLMRRIVQRDQHALTALYDRYSSAVYSLALRIMGATHPAEDVTQDTFLKVWNQAGHWDSTKGQLIGWLLTITRYTAIDHLRKERRRPLQVELNIEIQASSEMRWNDGDLLRTLLERLPPEQAEVISLGFFGGMTHSEMSETLHLPLGTVKTRVRLGLQKLREMWLESERKPNKT